MYWDPLGKKSLHCSTNPPLCHWGVQTSRGCILVQSFTEVCHFKNSPLKAGFAASITFMGVSLFPEILSAKLCFRGNEGKCLCLVCNFEAEVRAVLLKEVWASTEFFYIILLYKEQDWIIGPEEKKLETTYLTQIGQRGTIKIPRNLVIFIFW